VPAEESTDRKLPAVVSREADESLARERATETGQTTLSLKDSALPKDDASALKFEQEKQKLQPTRTPAPDADVRSAPATPSPAPQIASRDATPTTAPLTLQKNVEQPARDIRADDARGEHESRRAFAEAPPASAPEKLGASRAIPSSTSTGSVAATAGAALALGSTETAPAPAAAAPVLSESAEAAAFSSRYGIPAAAAASVAQRYTQTQVNGGLRPAAIAAAPTTQVLSSFQLEQTGDQLRVIDSDGSTYTGAITSPAADRYGKSIELKGATALKTGDKAAARAISTPESFAYEPGQNYLFRVTGTNRTLQQPVVFAGNILILTNASATQTAAARSQKQFAPAQNQMPGLLNSTISGKVQLGTSREMQINAVPVNP
jgi:hypothetical protein